MKMKKHCFDTAFVNPRLTRGERDTYKIYRKKYPRT